MVSAILIVKNPGSNKWEGMGTHEFAVLPRVGDNIDLDIDGIGYSYGVVAVHHPGEPASTAGDIYAVRLGTTSDVVLGLFENSIAAS